MRYVTVLGATGSIGKSTLDVIRRHPDLFSVYGLAASTSIDAMIDSIREFKPKVVAMSSQKAAIELLKRVKELQLPCEVLFGDDGVQTLAGDGSADIVVGAIVGAAGLRPLIAAAKTGCIIALANKEALVMSGTIFFETAKKYGARVLPVDSEHSAIFQSLPFEVQENLGFCDLKNAHVDKILLTGSGGPFRDTPIKDLELVDAKTAVAHPVWSMGPKISVDSATMMNKGLEFIEARYLFNADDSDIQVVIHPQSVIHSMVSYEDGAVMAQLGNPDMRTPIAVALGFPERISSGVKRLDFTKLSSLTFMEPDFSRYPCLKLAMQASKSGQSATTALNAANEVAVASFLESKIKFTDIYRVVESVLCSNTCKEPSSIDEVLSIDETARKSAADYIGKLNG
ncbi:1-deoxy-D-xylulose-5-phosphate reductoisomerase [Succinivibrio sp.]|uniref:1-deoxy-D-xylulose-5-phosphate reductoisomerase n=1 Tax=Succinivibrio sp. TaxID=2053619 RepID=UPI003870B30E